MQGTKRWMVVAGASVLSMWIASQTVLTAAQKVDGATQPGSATQARSANKPVIGEPRNPRMPNYFNQVINEQQRAEIVTILKKYAPQIERKQAELAALTSERDETVFAVLSPQQRRQVEALRAAAQAKRSKSTGTTVRIADESDE